MKRGAPLRRRRQSSRKKPLTSKKETLRRGKGLRRGATSYRLPSAWKPLFQHWCEVVVNQVRVCAVCGEGPKAKDPAKRKRKKFDPHHIIPARYIRRYMRQYRKKLDAKLYDEMLGKLLYNPVNGLCICRECHERHEKASKRIPRALISEEAREFARSLNLYHLIESMYPEV